MCIRLDDVRDSPGVPALLAKRGGRRNLSYDLPWPDSRGVDIGDRFVSDLFCASLV